MDRFFEGKRLMANIYRLVARNIYAKHSGCTRREAERVLTNLSDEDCAALAAMTPADAAVAVKDAVVQAAERIVSDATKEPSVEVTAGLSDAVGVVADTSRDADVELKEQGAADGEEETGLNPAGEGDSVREPD